MSIPVFVEFRAGLTDFTTKMGQANAEVAALGKKGAATSAQLASAAKQYCDPVDKGLVDVETGLAECQKQIKAAGIDTIVAELQKQIDAWKASQ